ncbi:hypothetical protein FRC09_010498, partial [Ceratobasidium sp. 395]
MSTLPHDADIKHQPPRTSGEHAPLVSNDPHVRTPVPAREQSTIESLSAAFRGLGSMARASTQQSRMTTYASPSPSAGYLDSPAPTGLGLSDDDGGPEESLYAQLPGDALDGHDAVTWSGWDEVEWGDHSAPRRGLQVWDCSTDKVREVLNLLSPTIGAVLSAAVIPAPAISLDDSLAEE